MPFAVVPPMAAFEEMYVSPTDKSPMPGTMRFAVLAWLVAATVLLLAAASFLFTAQTQRHDSQGLLTLGALGAGLGLLTGFQAVRLRRGRRSSREILTTVALIAGVPLTFRGPALMALGILLLACAGLLWLPESNRFFASRDPKVRRRILSRPR